MKGRFLKKILSVTMALAVTAGMMCIGAVTARGAEVDVVPLNAVQKLTNNSTISSTLISKGETLTVNAQAGGGQGGYTYAVLYRKKTDKDWTVRQGYKDNATIIVKPAKDTDYDVCVKVKDISGTIAKKFFEIKVNPKLQNDSAISKTTIRQGDTVTVTAKVQAVWEIIPMPCCIKSSPIKAGRSDRATRIMQEFLSDLQKQRNTVSA